MPEYSQFYDDDMQGHSLSLGHSNDSPDISTSIRLLLLNSGSIGVTVVKKCVGISFCVDLWE
jgi:hypothetical protein